MYQLIDDTKTILLNFYFENYDPIINLLQEVLFSTAFLKGQLFLGFFSLSSPVEFYKQIT